MLEARASGLTSVSPFLRNLKMRRALNAFYGFTVFLAAAAMVSIAGLILVQVVLRLFGTQLKSADDFAGYALVATIMLGLAPTYRHNAQIRVGLIIERFALHSPIRRMLELFVVALSFVLVAWASWISLHFVYESYIYNEMSQGLLAIPLWMPQFFMAFGLTSFALALLDDLIVHLMGGMQSHLAHKTSADEMPVEK
jgi:TRAP-type C4-dicarboxylate transport system permease small subunit